MSAMRAATVDPVGLKANRSVNLSPEGGWCNAGYMYVLTPDYDVFRAFVTKPELSKLGRSPSAALAWLSLVPA